MPLVEKFYRSEKTLQESSCCYYFTDIQFLISNAFWPWIYKSQKRPLYTGIQAISNEIRSFLMDNGPFLKPLIDELNKYHRMNAKKSKTHCDIVRVDLRHSAVALSLYNLRHCGDVQHVGPVEQLLRPVHLQAHRRNRARSEVPYLCRNKKKISQIYWLL